MSRLKYGILAAALAVWATGTAAAELKVGFVNAARLLEEAPQAESAAKKLKQEFDAKQEKLLTQQKEAKRLDEDLSRNGAVMSATQRRDKERDLQNLQREIRREQEDFRDDVNVRRNEVLGRIQEQVQKTIEDVASEENYDLVLYEGVAYASTRIDITDKVLARLKSAAAKPAEGKK